MPSLLQIWIEFGAAAIVLLLIPAYMGYIHVAPLAAAGYALFAGTAMAIGEQLQFEFGRFEIAPSDIVLWTLSIAGVGGVCYVLALIFI